MKKIALKQKVWHPRSPRGFTLVEMLVVVAIIVTLVAITVPVLSFARRAACRMSGQTQITALSSACNQYYLEQDRLPLKETGWQGLGVSCWPNYNCSNPSNSAQQWPGSGFTKTENLVLVLMGGNVPNTSTRDRTIGVTYPYLGANYNRRIWQKDDPMGYDPYAVGKGPYIGPGATMPPLRHLDCYYKYKADELVDFDGNGLYEFKDKGFLGMPIVYYLYDSGNAFDPRENGSKYFNGPDGRGGTGDTYNYKIYDPCHPEVAPVPDTERNAITHYIKGTYNDTFGARWGIYTRTWPGAGGITSGTYANQDSFILVSAGPDGIFGPDPNTMKTDTGLMLNVNNTADQLIIRQKIVDCDDVTNWNRK